ncbi:MAG TPA: M56 family metallopeptidase [Candidatus Baltobacteraceae bacterium]|jgi:beta-lactamase regulating signal transducer with metallopeptidase domain|nr:M56 family metallopeptidase [Candidatus Baltobacteraceae bacterium]
MNSGHVYLALLNSLWQSAALAGAVALIVRAFGALSASARSALWLAVLLACAVLPVVDFLIPARTIPVPAPAAVKSSVARVLPALAAGAPLRRPQASPRDLGMPARGNPVRIPDAFPAYVWALVSGALLIRLGFGYVRLRGAKSSLRRSSSLTTRVSNVLHGRPALVGISATLPEPCAIGFFHPAIAIPAGLAATVSDGDLERILRHECAHIARFDDCANLLRQIVKAVLFFNPAVHFAAHNMAVECEIACDDAAARADRERVAFAKCLYEIARESKRRTYSPAAGFFGSRRQIVTRVTRLLERNHRASTSLGVAVKCAAACVFAGGIALGGLRFSAQAECPFPAVPLYFTGSTVTVNGTAHRPLLASNAQAWSVHAATASVRPVLADAGAPPSIVASRRSITTVRPAVVQVRVHEHLHLRLRAQIAYEQQQEGDAGSRHDGDLIDALASAGYRGLSADDLIELANHGVTASFISRLRTLGFAPLPVASLVELVDHGVSPDFIAGMRGAGYSNVAVEDLIRLADHGVTVDFVNRIVRSGIAGSHPSVRDLIRMADAGI